MNTTTLETPLAPTRTADGASLAHEIEQVKTRARAVAGRVTERVRAKEAEYADHVRQRPVRSLLIAAGVGAGLGLVLGVVLARR